MKKFPCVIIDDEKHSISILKDHIASMSDLTLVKSYNNPLTALSEIKTEDGIQIAFIDIDMPHISGLELAQSLKGRVKFIIFTTAHDKYAVEAFDIRAYHFMVKPIVKAKFIKIVSDLINLDKEESYETKIQKRNFFFINPGEKGKLSKIKKEKILFFEGAKNYVNIVTEDKAHMVYLTLKEVEKDFDDELFYRVHRSFIVNGDKVEKIVGNNIIIGPHIVVMGNGYKDKFLRFLEVKTLRSGRSS